MVDRPSLWFRAFVWCLLLAFTSGALANASSALGAVLCIGGDGHVAIETARGPDCIDFRGDFRGTDAAHEAQAGAVTASHCGDCFDIVLANATVASPSFKASDAVIAQDIDAAPAVSPSAPLSFHAYALVCVLGPPPIPDRLLPNFSLLAHRSDVLLV